ncbi:hypothetical protein FNV43_RR10246 [Rhamnella rubrinervis]|uniref:Uncharacterized protein n=1 Tax=Rhamnella rubrinervis TaxID=2594499 RepID=A0A8K0HBI4_9ROSA|nr:hypothetical protein FNV43_RR10246 [Rhamnella rubrinervis]
MLFGDSAFEPFLEYSGRSSSPTPSFSSVGSAVRIVELNQVAEQNLVPYIEPNVSHDEPNEHRPTPAIQHPTLIKTDIPSIFKPKDKSYLKKRYGFPENVVLSAPTDKERANSVRDGWICFYEIAFKLGLRLLFHRIISMVLKFLTLPVMRAVALPLGAIPTSDKVEGRILLRQKRVHSILLARLEFARCERALIQSAKLSANTKQNESIDILYAAEKNLNLLLTAKSFPDMGKMKVAPPTTEQLAEKERRRKDKKAARKISRSGPSKEHEPTPGGTIIVQPKGLVAAATVERSPPQKKQRRASPPDVVEDKEPLAPRANLGLEDSSSIRSDANLAAPIVDCLMTHHDRNILKSMPLDDVCQEAKQGALKVDNAFKKKTAAYTNAIAINKTLEADIVQFKETAVDANARAEQAEKKWSEAYQKLIEKEKELESLRLDFSRRTPEPNEDEGDDGETSEISSTESEPKLDHQTEDPSTVQEKSSSQTKDSFDEAMEAARTDTPGLSANAKEVASASQPNQEEAQ